MNKKHLNKRNILSLILFLAIILILVVFNNLSTSIDKTTEKVFYSLIGETEPDTNIIVININEDDINKLGPWPIKRSYYALIINNLSKLNVKTIGLAVFLSARFSSRAVYDNLLTREIEKAGNVILSSVAGNIYKSSNKYYTDSLSYPTPKLLNEEIPTGHLNYLEEKNIEIPAQLNANEIIEKAFSVKLGTTYNKRIENEIISVNFISGEDKFNSYNLLEFFRLVQINSQELRKFKNKIVIIGISDPQIAKTFSTSFSKNLSGVYLHAFALDNILNERYLKTDLLILSKLIFAIISVLLFLLTLSNIKPQKIVLIFSSLIILLIVSFVFFSYLNYQLSYSFYLIPMFFVIVLSFILKFQEKEKQYEETIDEKFALENLLNNKEKELNTLQKNLEETKGKPESLLLKINELNKEIEKLKDKEEDKIAAEPFEASVENYEGIIYRSQKMKPIVNLIEKAAPENATILITGKSGTGKELVAKAIHNKSKRSENNFIIVNCGALSENLLESELFGHTKGSFTGAINDKIGKFEAADNGTIFLDEIAETSENFQVKLLRVIQYGEFDKVGSSKIQKADVRFIAATNKNLEEEVKNKNFREDLFYRLNVIRINLPSLKERKEDIEILAQQFVKKENNELQLSKAVLQALNEYDWKGNVRELESVIKRAAIFTKTENRLLIQLRDLPESLTKNIKLNFEDLVLQSLREKKFSHSSITETAKELGGVNRTLVSENFRGIAFKLFVENNFNEKLTVKIISQSEDENINELVRNKLNTFLYNVKKDIEVLSNKSFDEVKEKLKSKYKNLPQRFHFYLDAIIKNFLE